MLRVRTVCLWTLSAILALGLLGTVAMSQDKKEESDKGEKKAQPDRKDRGDRGNRTPEEWKKRMEEFRATAATRMKEQLGVNDEEWKVMQPLIEKVTTAAREARGGMFGGLTSMFGGRGRGPGGGDRPGGGDTDRPQNDLEKKGGELRKVLENKDAKTEDVKAALDGLRTARKAAEQKHEAAQEELKKVLTVVQEAKLVNMGVLR